MIAKIQIRRGTTAEWAAASPVVLAAGEPGYDVTKKGTKIGDGSTEWAGLPWSDAVNSINPRSVSAYGAKGDGVTVDNDAIAAAIAATPSGGTLVFDAQKTYLITLAISITKPMTIDLNGSTLLGDASVTSEIYAAVITSDNVTIQNGIIDMNLSFEGGMFSNGYGNLRFTDLTFKNLAVTAGGSETSNPIPYHSSGNSIFIIGSDNIIIDRCNFFNCWNSDSPGITESNPFKGGGIVMWSSCHAWLTKLYFNHTGGGINLSKSSDFYIDNVHMYDIHDNGYYIQDDLYQVYSTNPETIHNIHLSNISIKGANEGIAFSVCRNYPENAKLANFKITNAHFENCDYAFYIRKGSGFQAENISVIDCIHTMRVGGLYLYNSGAGPDYYRCTDISFDGLNVSNALKVSASGTGGAEIRVIRSDRVEILNSTQMGTYTTTTDYHGIRLTYCDDCLLCNNRIIGPASGTVLTRGLSIDTCTDCTAINPFVKNAATKVYTAGGSGNVIDNLRP